MCEQGANYTTTEAMRDIVQAMGADLPPSYLPRPFDRQTNTLIIRNGPDGARETAYARLGMPTPLAKLRPKQRVDRGQVNIASLTYGHWWQFMGVEHRCVIPVTQFGERDTVGETHQMIPFGLRGGATFYLAGLWTRWGSVRSQAEGFKELDGYAIITAAANAEVSQVHNRMPVVLLSQEGVDAWLSLPPEGAIRMQRSLPAGHIVRLDQPKGDH